MHCRMSTHINDAIHWSTNYSDTQILTNARWSKYISLFQAIDHCRRTRAANRNTHFAKRTRTQNSMSERRVREKKKNYKFVLPIAITSMLCIRIMDIDMRAPHVMYLLFKYNYFFSRFPLALTHVQPLWMPRFSLTGRSHSIESLITATLRYIFLFFLFLFHLYFDVVFVQLWWQQLSRQRCVWMETENRGRRDKRRHINSRSNREAPLSSGKSETNRSLRAI